MSHRQSLELDSAWEEYRVFSTMKGTIYSTVMEIKIKSKQYLMGKNKCVYYVFLSAEKNLHNGVDSQSLNHFLI